MAFWDFLAKLIGLEKTPKRGPAQVWSPPSSAPASVDPQVVSSAPSQPAVASDTSAKASNFLPIKRSELLKQGEEVRRTTGWMFFGRRDLIPPTADPRTLLIDRGMVTQGFLQPDELAEMHRVGDEHAKYANRLQQINIEAGKTADQAVAADRTARAAVKAQKKAESAVRKQKRVEVVAVRKTTDIRFVGRGVSAMLNHRVSDGALLTAAGLPILGTPHELASALSLTVSQLRWLCFHTEAATRIHYVQFEIPKKSGGTRTLSASHTKLAACRSGSSSTSSRSFRRRSRPTVSCRADPQSPTPQLMPPRI